MKKTIALLLTIPLTLIFAMGLILFFLGEKKETSKRKKAINND
jgi:flagellar basal body-associated protein FliL